MEHLEEDGRLKGTPLGSTFALTEKGYMTDEAYANYADHLINRLEIPLCGHCWCVTVTTVMLCCPMFFVASGRRRYT